MKLKVSFNVSTFRRFNFLTIDGDATVWADDGAGRASCAGIGVDLLHIAVTSVVHHLVCELNDVERTRHHAERTTFAALCVDDDGSFHFCHSVCYLVGERSL